MNRSARKAMALRHSRFRAALALACITAAEWCSEHNISEGHLYQVFRGTRVSPPLCAKIDAFCAKQLGEKPTSAAVA